MKIIALLLVAIAAQIAALLMSCDNENINLQLSKSTSEAGKHAGVILYDNYNFKLVRVKIDGVDYIANSNGGLIVAPWRQYE